MTSFRSFPLTKRHLIIVDHEERDRRRRRTGEHSVTWDNISLRDDIHEWFANRRRRYMIEYGAGRKFYIRMHRNLAVLFKLTWSGL